MSKKMMTPGEIQREKMWRMPKAPRPDFEVGQVVDGREVMGVRPVMRPFKNKGQDTYPVSWVVAWRTK